MIHNMIGGGGQGDGPVEAGTIVVTYPSGSTCTVTNGSQTYTALDTSGAAAFVVEPGTWTVSAVQGSDSDSESVTVTAGGWVEVELSFVEWLYNLGKEYSELTGGWTTVKQGSNGSVKKNDTSILVTAGGDYQAVFVRTQNIIDLSNYSQCHINVLDVQYEGSYATQCRFGVIVENPFTNQFLAFTTLTTGENRVDISAITSSYVGVMVSAVASVEFDRVWLS